MTGYKDVDNNFVTVSVAVVNFSANSNAMLAFFWFKSAVSFVLFIAYLGNLLLQQLTTKKHCVCDVLFGKWI